MNMLSSSRKKSPRDAFEKENSVNGSTATINKHVYTPNFNRKRRGSHGSTNKSTAKKQKTTPMITKRMSIPNRPSRISKRDSALSMSNEKTLDGFPSVESCNFSPHNCSFL